MSVQNYSFEDLHHRIDTVLTIQHRIRTWECLSPPLLSPHAAEHLGVHVLLFVQTVPVASAKHTHKEKNFFHVKILSAA